MKRNNVTLTASQKRILETHHEVHLSRRQLMGLGLVAGVSGFISSNPLQGPFNFAQAQHAELPVFITIDLIGGASITGNFLFGGPKGPTDLISTYAPLGWNPRQTALDSRFGLPAAGNNVSRFLTGMLQAMSPAAQANFKISGIAHKGQLDSSSGNVNSAIGEVARIQSILGGFPGQGYALQSTTSGGRTQMVKESPQFAVKAVSDNTQLINTLSTGYLKQFGFESADLERTLSEAAKSKGSDEFTKVLRDFGAGVLDETKVDALKDDDTRAVFQLSQNSSAIDLVEAGIVFNCMMGHIGPSCIARDARDYHDGTQTTGDGFDQLDGLLLGRIVELAHRKKKKVMIQVVTDGGIVSDPGSRIWRGDSQESATLCGFYSPQRFAQVKAQLGHYDQNHAAVAHPWVGTSGGVDRLNPNVAYTVALNYLSVTGQLGKARSLYTEGEIPSSVIDQVLLFA